jgi:hypothetical protein
VAIRLSPLFGVQTKTSGAMPMALHGHVFSHEVSKARTTDPSEAVRCQVVLNHRPRFWDGRPVCGAAIAAAGVCGAAVPAAVFVVQPSRPECLWCSQPGRTCRRDARTTNSPGRSRPRATFGRDLWTETAAGKSTRTSTHGRASVRHRLNLLSSPLEGEGPRGYPGVRGRWACPGSLNRRHAFRCPFMARKARDCG